MKKLLTYLILITCIESFISATHCLSVKHKKVSDITRIDIPAKDKVSQQVDISTEIHPLDIFTFRYF